MTIALKGSAQTVSRQPANRCSILFERARADFMLGKRSADVEKIRHCRIVANSVAVPPQAKRTEVTPLLSDELMRPFASRSAAIEHLRRAASR